MNSTRKIVKQFSQFLVEQNRTDLQELYAAGLVGLKDYLQYVIDSEPDLDQWVEQNVIFVKRSRIVGDRVLLVLIYNNKTYRTSVPLNSDPDAIELLKSDFIKKVEDPIIKFVMQLKSYSEGVPINYNKPFGYYLSRLTKIDNTESIDIGYNVTEIASSCFKVLNNNGIFW